MKDLQQQTHELTPRQWSLYRLLKSDPNHWYSQEEICEIIPDYTYIDDERNHCVAIGDDRIVLNESPVIDKIIVTKKHQFKIASYEEYMQERAYHIRRLKSQVAQIEAMDRKFERNGQVKLFNNILEELKENNEQYHETFFEDERWFALIDDGREHVSIVKCNQVIRINERIVEAKGGSLDGYRYCCSQIELVYNPKEYKHKNYSVMVLGKE